MSGEEGFASPSEGIVDTVSGFGSFMSRAGSEYNTALENDEGVQVITQWATFGVAGILAWRGIDELISRFTPLDGDGWLSSMARTGIALAIALPLASGIGTWVGTSRDISELPEHLMRGFTDMYGQNGLLGGVTGLFNLESGAAPRPTAVEPVPAAVEVSTFELSTDVLAAYAGRYDDPSAIGFDDALPAATINTANIDARLATLKDASLFRARAADLPTSPTGEFELSVEGEGDDAVYSYRVVTRTATGVEHGEPQTITQEVYDSLLEIQQQREQTQGFADAVELYNESVTGLVTSYYAMAETFGDAGLPEGVDPGDAGRLQRTADGEFQFTTDEGEVLRLSEEQYNAMREYFDRSEQYASAYEGIQVLSEDLSRAHETSGATTDPALAITIGDAPALEVETAALYTEVTRGVGAPALA